MFRLLISLIILSNIDLKTGDKKSFRPSITNKSISVKWILNPKIKIKSQNEFPLKYIPLKMSCRLIFKMSCRPIFKMSWQIQSQIKYQQSLRFSFRSHLSLRSNDRFSLRSNDSVIKNYHNNNLIKNEISIRFQ
jgi:hypothetical protein